MNNNANTARTQVINNIESINENRSRKTKGNFYRTPTWILELDGTQLKIILYLCGRLDGQSNTTCQVSFNRISERIGIKRRAVISNIKKLIDTGRIKQHKQYRDNGSYSSNKYEIMFENAGGVVHGETLPSAPKEHYPSAPAENTTLVHQLNAPAPIYNSFSSIANKSINVCTNVVENGKTTHTLFPEELEFLYSDYLIELALKCWNKHKTAYKDTDEYIGLLSRMKTEVVCPTVLDSALTDYLQHKPGKSSNALWTSFSVRNREYKQKNQITPQGNYEEICEIMWDVPLRIQQKRKQEALQAQQQEEEKLSALYQKFTDLPENDKTVFFQEFNAERWHYLQGDLRIAEISAAADRYQEQALQQEAETMMLHLEQAVRDRDQHRFKQLTLSRYRPQIAALKRLNPDAPVIIRINELAELAGFRRGIGWSEPKWS